MPARHGTQAATLDKPPSLDKPPELQFSHVGLTVSDLPKMEDFYTRVLGFTVTDRGFVESLNIDLLFLTLDPYEHHQVAMVTGRPEGLPRNVLNPMFGAVINQISFRLKSVADLRAMYQRLEDEGVTGMQPASHGAALSVYAPDPEGNILEFFVDMPYYIDQPVFEPIDITLPDEDILQQNEAMCRKAKGFRSFADFRADMATKMGKPLRVQ